MEKSKFLLCILVIVAKVKRTLDGLTRAVVVIEVNRTVVD